MLEPTSQEGLDTSTFLFASSRSDADPPQEGSRPFDISCCPSPQLTALPTLPQTPPTAPASPDRANPPALGEENRDGEEGLGVI